MTKRSEGSPPGATQTAQESKRDAGEIYSKPFLKRFGRNVYLGGYMDLEYFLTEGKNNDTFDQHRFVPFIYADVSDHIKVAAEIEIEHGNGTELGIEFAQIDYWIAPFINFRAGIILDPLGHYNLVHDAPFKDLTTRPLVDEVLIPVVLREPGIGFFGSFGTGSWEFDYEVYLVNGFSSSRGYNGLRDSAGTASVEVLKGPASALYGRGEPGGTVNITTKKPRFEPSYELDVSIASHETYRTALDLTGPISENLAYRLNGAYEKGDSFRDTVETERSFLSPSFIWLIGDHTRVSYEVEASEQRVPV